MPYKRRLSKARNVQITPEAIRLYERAKQLKRRKQTEEVQRELNDLWGELHFALELRPYDQSPIDGPPPEKPSGNHPEQIASFERECSAYEGLEAALRERASRHANGASTPPTPAPPIAAAPREGEP
jgi:hypothetical protein